MINYGLKYSNYHMWEALTVSCASSTNQELFMKWTGVPDILHYILSGISSSNFYCCYAPVKEVL